MIKTEFSSFLILSRISHISCLFLSDFFSNVIIFDHCAQQFNFSDTWMTTIYLERLCLMKRSILRVDLLFRFQICLHVLKFSVYAFEYSSTYLLSRVFHLQDNVTSLQCFELHFNYLWKFKCDQIFAMLCII